MSIDVVARGDHGQGAFVVGLKVIVNLKEPIPEGVSSDSEDDAKGNNKLTSSFSFEISA